MTENTDDKYIGEIFASKDIRDLGRRIRIVEKHPDQGDGKAGYYEQVGPRLTFTPHVYYRAVRVDELGKQVVKQRTRIAAKTIDDKFRKVSR